MISLFLLLALFVFLFLGIPVAISLGLASTLTMLFFGNQSMLSMAQKFFHTTQVYPLLAVPFFILAGTFLTTGGVAKRMIAFANALVGHFRGGLAMVNIFSSMLFGGISGSAISAGLSSRSTSMAVPLRSSRSVRRAAIEAVGAIDASSRWTLIQPLLGDPILGVRLAAASALSVTTMPSRRHRASKPS